MEFFAKLKKGKGAIIAPVNCGTSLFQEFGHILASSLKPERNFPVPTADILILNHGGFKTIRQNASRINGLQHYFWEEPDKACFKRLLNIVQSSGKIFFRKSPGNKWQISHRKADNFAIILFGSRLQPALSLAASRGSSIRFRCLRRKE